MFAFDGEADGIPGCEQKQFAEMANKRECGYKAQEGARQTWRQFSGKRNTRPNRANANY